MSKCIFCSRKHNRTYYNTDKTTKYCSTKCIKRAYYLRKNPDIQSSLRGDKGFWKTETGIGYYWEQYVAKKMKGEHLPFNKSGADVSTSIGDVDVKVCNKYNTQWVFNRNKYKPNISWYYCICLESNKPVKELLIPSKDFAGKGITVGTNSPKYDKYIVHT